MKIWELRSDTNDDLQFFTVENEIEWSKLDLLNRRNKFDIWNPPVLRIGKNSKGKQGTKESDNPYLSPGIPVFSSYAINVLSDLLKDCIELLPVNFHNYYVANVIDINEYIDRNKAMFKYFPHSERIMRCLKYSFKQNDIVGKHIFKTTEFPTGLVLTSDKFREKVLSSGLIGFNFIELWDSEQD